MQTPHPLVLVLFILLALGLIGGIAAFIRDRRRFAGFRHLTKEVLRLGKTVHGEVFRDGADLVVNGTWRGLPVDIRFSHLESTPGTDIRMGAPADFTLFISPRSLKAPEGAAALRTPDEMFNVRAQVRSNHPTQAGLFLSTKNVLSSLIKLYRSSQTYLRIKTGLLELTDLESPSEDSISAIPTQLDAMAALAQQLKEMPGSSRVKVEALKREPRYLYKFAILAGIVAVTVAVLVETFKPEAAQTPTQSVALQGIVGTDAAHIPNAGKWHLALPQNFDQEAAGWVRSSGVEPTSKIQADFSGNGSEEDIAYVLEAADGRYRVVMLSNGKNVHDNQYGYVGVAARVRKSVLSSIRWAGAPPEESDGDGLFILRTPNDPSSGLIIFVKGDRVISAAPKDYRTIRLE